MTGVLTGRRKCHSKDTHTHTLTHTHTGDDRGTDCNDVAESQGKPGTDGYHQKLGKGKEGFYAESQREYYGPVITMISEF